MKKTGLLLLLATALLFSSCALANGRWLYQDNPAIADETFSQILDAIKEKNEADLIAMFSKTTQQSDGFANSISQVMEFMQGDILTVSHAIDSGTRGSSKTDHGKTVRNINSAVAVTTSESTYYLAVIIRTQDDYDKDNEGIYILAIIESCNWLEDSVYHADEDEEPKIYIITEPTRSKPGPWDRVVEDSTRDGSEH